MGWEGRQRGGRYYVRARKVGGRVVKEYVGTGPVAEAAAALDAEERALRAAAAGARRAERARLRATDAALAEFDEALDAAVRVVLRAAGYHQHHRGEWRRRRGGKGGQAGNG